MQVLPGRNSASRARPVIGRCYGAFGTLIYLILLSDFSPRISFEIVESLDDIRDRYGQLGA
jgi:hypothetical protein